MLSDNLILLTDSYKTSHSVQYPPWTESVYSYFESRGTDLGGLVFFGLQYLLKKYLSQPITSEMVAEAKNFIDAHMGPGIFNLEGWEHIVSHHGGKLPVSIRALPEGTVIGPRQVMMTVENTDPVCWWLTNYLETLLVQVWYPTTVASLSREIKRLIKGYLVQTSTDEDPSFKLHDFGFRGVSSVESAGIGGCAHLVNFRGTDTMEALVVADKYYSCPMAGFSIPAAEHSTITSWGDTEESETKAFDNMLEQYPTGLVAVVSDSYDIYRACTKIWGDTLRKKVVARNGTVVIRPDSGDPLVVLPQILETLAHRFGYTTNLKGYKVLNPEVRVIQGDGVDLNSISRILASLTENKWATENIAFGMGGALLQKLNRDTCKFAFKCSSVTIKKTERAVYKNPVHDSGKSSKRGRMVLLPTGTKSELGYSEWTSLLPQDKLVEVFRNGELKVDHSLAQVRERATV